MILVIVAAILCPRNSEDDGIPVNTVINSQISADVNVPEISAPSVSEINESVITIPQIDNAPAAYLEFRSFSLPNINISTELKELYKQISVTKKNIEAQIQEIKENIRSKENANKSVPPIQDQIKKISHLKEKLTEELSINKSHLANIEPLLSKLPDSRLLLGDI